MGQTKKIRKEKKRRMKAMTIMIRMLMISLRKIQKSLMAQLMNTYMRIDL